MVLDITRRQSRHECRSLLGCTLRHAGNKSGKKTTSRVTIRQILKPRDRIFRIGSRPITGSAAEKVILRTAWLEVLHRKSKRGLGVVMRPLSAHTAQNILLSLAFRQLLRPRDRGAHVSL